MRNMSRFTLTLGLIVAALAFAGGGTRFVETAGTVPSSASDGVALKDSVGCRISARKNDAGVLTAGDKLLVHYYDPAIGWVEGQSVLTCTVAVQTDGGTRSKYVCSDLEPLARFGRVGASLYGTSTGVTVRTECWGPELQPVDGGSR